MIKGKIFTNLEFETGGIAEEQLVEFMKISRELRGEIEKIRAGQKKKNRLYKNASSIRYGELK